MSINQRDMRLDVAAQKTAQLSLLSPRYSMSLGLFCTYLLGLSLGAYLSLENIPSTLELYLGCKAQEIRTWVLSGVLLFAGASLVIGGRAILICALFLGEPTHV